MDFDLSRVWTKTEAMLNGLLAMLPNIVLAVLVFMLFALVAKWLRALVRHVALRYGRHQNLGLVMGRLAQGTLLFVGLLVALSVALPTHSRRIESRTAPTTGSHDDTGGTHRPAQVTAPISSTTRTKMKASESNLALFGLAALITAILVGLEQATLWLLARWQR
jgi:hypothetical protein